MTAGKKGLLIAFVIITVLLIVLVGGYVFLTMRYPLDYEDSITYWAGRHDLDPYYVASIVWAESRYRPEEESGVGARGLMQIMPETGEWIAGKIDLEDFDPEMLYIPDTNIRLGCWYMNYLDDRFAERDSKTAAYNAGHNRVQTWLEDPRYSADGKTLDKIPYEETDEYVKRVNQAYDVYKLLYNLES